MSIATRDCYFYKSNKTNNQMALEWIGYIEGAIESEERFAQDIIGSF